MTDKRCPKCGMSVEETAQKCECGFDFTTCTLTKEEMEKEAKKNSGIGLRHVVFFLVVFAAGPMMKAFIDSFGYGAALCALAVLLIVAAVLWVIVRAVERKHKK